MIAVVISLLNILISVQIIGEQVTTLHQSRDYFWSSSSTFAVNVADSKMVC